MNAILAAEITGVYGLFRKDETMKMLELADQTKKDVLKYEHFSGFQGRPRVQWSYVDAKGDLHHAICGDIETARTQAARYGFEQGASEEIEL